MIIAIFFVYSSKSHWLKNKLICLRKSIKQHIVHHNINVFWWCSDQDKAPPEVFYCRLKCIVFVKRIKWVCRVTLCNRGLINWKWCSRFWKGMYSRAEKSVASYQSPADCLNAVREESQQLEEELSAHQEVPRETDAGQGIHLHA